MQNIVQNIIPAVRALAITLVVLSIYWLPVILLHYFDFGKQVVISKSFDVFLLSVDFLSHQDAEIVFVPMFVIGVTTFFMSFEFRSKEKDNQNV